MVASVGNIPWLLLGDFDVVLSQHDRINGAGITSYDTQDFEQFLLHTCVPELKATWHFYSWSNKGLGDDRITSRIDRSLGNGIG